MNVVEYAKSVIEKQRDELIPFFHHNDDAPYDIVTVSMRYDIHDPNSVNHGSMYANCHQPYQEIDTIDYEKESINQLISSLPKCIIDSIVSINKNITYLEKTFSEDYKYHKSAVNSLVSFIKDVIDTGNVKYVIMGPNLYHYIHYWIHENTSMVIEDGVHIISSFSLLEKKLDNVLYSENGSLIGMKGSIYDHQVGEKDGIKFFKYWDVEDIFFINDQLADLDTFKMNLSPDIGLTYRSIEFKSKVYTPKILRVKVKINDKAFGRECKLKRILK